jgi:hypothetical protein
MAVVGSSDGLDCYRIASSGQALRVVFLHEMNHAFAHMAAQIKRDGRGIRAHQAAQLHRSLGKIRHLQHPGFAVR